MTLITLTSFLGHFHPVLVHLPIGVLMVAILFQLMQRRGMNKLLALLYGIGVLSALASCITGYLLFVSGEYEDSVVSWHLWLAILVTATALLLFWRSVQRVYGKISVIISVVLLALLLVTGHLGGTLTHGEGYLSFSQIAAPDSAYVRKPVPNIDSAAIFAELIQPVLMEKCGACHSAVKQKGGLRIDEKEYLMKGGKDGPVLIPASTTESHLWQRINLGENNDDHMPPKESTQLSEQEIALFKWWIEAGCPFDKQVFQIAATEQDKKMLHYFEAPAQQLADSEIPATEPEPAPEAIIRALEMNYVSVLPVRQGSKFLQVSAAGQRVLSDSIYQFIAALQNQLLYLRLGYTETNDSQLQIIGKCNRLIRLDLSHTRITDSGLLQLDTLPQLRQLNLTGTRVSLLGVISLVKMKRLNNLFLYKTAVDKEAWSELVKNFPTTQIDSGNYVVATLQTDTSRLKAPED